MRVLFEKLVNNLIAPMHKTSFTQIISELSPVFIVVFKPELILFYASY